MCSRAGYWVAVGWGLAVALCPNAMGDEPESLLVGVRAGGSELTTIEVRREDGRFLVPLEEFNETFRCQVEDEGEVPRLRTPLGAVPIPSDAIRLVDGVPHLTEQFLEGRLGASIAFDERDYALDLTPPWWEIDSHPESSGPSVTPDVVPPGVTLSTLREDLFYSRRVGDGRWNSATVVGGALGGGLWRVRYDTDLDRSRRMRDYAWYRVHERKLFLVGQQRIQLHPLLNGFELTGAQAAWTNQPLELFQQDLEARELLPRNVQSASTFRGAAPPGSLAQLEIDGVVIAQQVVAMSGEYEFLEVPLPARRLSRVEVHLFDRLNPSTPIAIHEQSASGTEFLLRRGAIVHMGGVGRYGNLANEILETEEWNGAAGFYQFRYGAHEAVTAEGAIQRSADTTQVMTGITTKLAEGWAMSMGLGAASGTADGSPFGYTLDLDGRTRRFRMRVGSGLSPTGFNFEDSERRVAHQFEGFFTGVRGLELGLVGLSREVASDTDSYLLPALTWNGYQKLSALAHPDLNGRYRFYSTFRPTDRDRLIASSDSFRAVNYAHDFSRRYRLDTGVVFGPGISTRYSVVVDRRATGSLGLAWHAGALTRDGEAGITVGATLPVAPGVLARADYESISVDSLTSSKSHESMRFGLTVDMTLAGGRLLPSRSAYVRRDRGAIVGRIRVADGGRVPRGSLEGVTVRIADRLAVRTDASGAFFAGNLEPGVYRVELGREDLMLDLVPRNDTSHVQVSPGATTRVDFIVTVEYGLAGRVTDDRGAPAVGARLRLEDAEGRVVARAVTDVYGLYRMDGVAAGSYVLRVDETSTSRRIEVVDDFLFGRDLEIPAKPLPRPEPPRLQGLLGSGATAG